MKKRINLTLPDDVLNVLNADAERNCRTISEEITYMVRTHKGEYATSSTTSLTTDIWDTPKAKKGVIE